MGYAPSPARNDAWWLAGLQPQWMLEDPGLEHEPRDEQEHQLEEENSPDHQGGVESSTTSRH